MALHNMGKSAMRVSKNYIKGYTDTQVKVRQATSNDAWGPSGQLMNEISQLSHNQNDFIEIMEILDKRLNDKGRNWRHVFKSLTLIDYLLHSGSENCILYFRDNMYVVKTLREFQHIDEDGKDQGANGACALALLLLTACPADQPCSAPKGQGGHQPLAGRHAPAF